MRGPHDLSQKQRAPIAIENGDEILQLGSSFSPVPGFRILSQGPVCRETAMLVAERLVACQE